MIVCNVLPAVRVATIGHILVSSIPIHYPCAPWASSRHSPSWPMLWIVTSLVLMPEGQGLATDRVRHCVNRWSKIQNAPNSYDDSGTRRLYSVACGPHGVPSNYHVQLRDAHRVGWHYLAHQSHILSRIQTSQV